LLSGPRPMIDLHCHILPGLDDGAEDLDTALAMAQIAWDDGIEVIVATPHVNIAGKPTPDEIRAATADLNQAIAAQGLALTVLPGAEVEAHPGVVALVREGELLTVADQGNYLLLEPPFVAIPTYLEQLCFELQIAGVNPILAHPERSELLTQRPEVYQNLADRGCLIQVNASSLRGRKSDAVRNKAVQLIRDGLVHILATDGHDCRWRPPRLSDVREVVVRASDEHTFTQMTEFVPGRIVHGA